MLRLTVSTEEYLMIGEDIKLVFLGGTGKHLRIMVDAPRDKNIVRSTVLERNITDPEERAKLPKYYAEEEHPEKYVRKDARKTKPEKAGIPMEKAETGKTESTEKGKAPGTLKNPRIIITRGNAGSR
ncbi:MAG: carbon storage regulator [Eubacterium sp.]|nr:carbon storage regulator [Eubacterium sp.]MCM1213854.1 carbon storage regulator [Lachnospiraceae bacterium]MCM1237973.1 carbon storage regulator [Lachnospiraceae bacterium]